MQMEEHVRTFHHQRNEEEAVSYISYHQVYLILYEVQDQPCVSLGWSHGQHVRPFHHNLLCEWVWMDGWMTHIGFRSVQKHDDFKFCFIDNRKSAISFKRRHGNIWIKNIETGFEHEYRWPWDTDNILTCPVLMILRRMGSTWRSKP